MLRRALALTVLILTPLVTGGCGSERQPTTTMEEIAERFVRLVLAVGLHDPDYVDAYFGPEDWRLQVEQERLALAQIQERASGLLQQLETTGAVLEDGPEARRRDHLRKSLSALIARVEHLSGRERSFDAESAALFDAVAPSYDANHFTPILERLETLLPGEGSLGERLESFKRDFVIPADRLDSVFRTAVEACRERTLEFIELPADESFEIEYVTDKSWSGYNWYQGDYHSLIQVNTDLPIYIDRALDLACHEGYPGHHLFNVLVEKNLLRERGWSEFAIYPLFSPRSLIAEGTANFGIEVAFPADHRVRYEAEVLFPLAGLDPERADTYYEIYRLTRELGHAGNQAARRYLDGEIDSETAVEWLTTYAMMSPERAHQRLAFIEKYRSYVINYNLGQDLVRDYVERHGGSAENPQRRWQLFAELLSDPYLPSQLR